MGISRPVRALIDPLIVASLSNPEKLAVAVHSADLRPRRNVESRDGGDRRVLPVAINATAGVLQIRPIYLDVGKSFKASRWDTFRTIALPGALPFIMTGVKLGAGLALILIAVAEMVGAKSGIGYMIWSAWETSRSPRCMSGCSSLR